LASGVALAVVPALVMQLAAQHSSMGTLDAVLLGLNVLVLAHGGGLILDAGSVTGSVSLLPLGMTAVLLVLTAGSVRRATRSLELVQDDGTVRERGLRDAATMVTAYVVLYAIGLGLLAAAAQSASVSPVLVSAVVSGGLIAVVGGLIGVGRALRRPADGNVPAVRILDLLPHPFGSVARALGIAWCGLFALGMLAVTALILWHFPEVTSLVDELDPGWAGGLVLTLLQLALLPVFGLWAVMLLFGGTISLGTGTALSLDGMRSGVLPPLPLLGALPDPGTAPGWTWALMALPVLVIALGAVRLGRELRGSDPRDLWTGMVAYPVLLVVSVLVVGALSGGSIGNGRLEHLGPQVASLTGLLALVAFGTSALSFAVIVTPLLPWSQEQIARLRSSVEAAEARERGEVAEESGSDAADGDDADVDDGDADTDIGDPDETEPEPDADRV
jgi:hypothetical protein